MLARFSLWFLRLGNLFLGFLLLYIVLFLVSVPNGVGAQTVATPTKLPGVIIFQPTAKFIPLNLIKLPSPIISSNIISSGLVLQKADLAYSTYFTGSMNIENPSVVILGNADSVKLIITPSVVSTDSAIQPELLGVADKITILPEIKPKKPLSVTAPLSWTWVIDPKTVGNHILLLNIIYEGNQGNISTARWDSIEIDLSVTLPASDTPTWTPSPTITLSPTKTPSQTITPSLTYTAVPTITVTSTSTPSNSEKIAAALVSNPTPCIGTSVTFLLGILTIYFQHVRKSSKKSSDATDRNFPEDQNYSLEDPYQSTRDRSWFRKRNKKNTDFPDWGIPHEQDYSFDDSYQPKKKRLFRRDKKNGLDD